MINRMPSSLLHGKTPYECLYGKPPRYEDIKVFGCLCFAHKASRDKDKFKEGSRKCVFVVYPFGKHGWKLYDLDSGEFFVSRDVVFTETSFPYDDIAVASGDATTLPVAQETNIMCCESPLLESRGSVEVEVAVTPTVEDSTEAETTEASAKPSDVVVVRKRGAESSNRECSGGTTRERTSSLTTVHKTQRLCSIQLPMSQ